MANNKNKMNRKDKKVFEELKKKLTINLLNMENKKRIPVFDYVPKMVYSGWGLLSMDMVEKCKLISDVDYHIVRKERFLLNLGKTSRKVN